MPGQHPTSLVDALTSDQRRTLHALVQEHDEALILTLVLTDHGHTITARVPDGPDVAWFARDAR